MIDNLKGVLLKKLENQIILNVNDIGYKIRVSSFCLNSLPPVGKRVSIIVFLYVRENILDLYGFKDSNERKLFNLLINIGGIGPKLALTILSGISLKNLKDYIVEGDVKSLTSISGVGTKTAKRMIIELKEKFINLDDDILGIKEEKDKPPLLNNVINALTNLGYKKNQAKVVCNKLLRNGQLNGNMETIIKKALAILMK